MFLVWFLGVLWRGHIACDFGWAELKRHIGFGFEDTKMLVS